MMRTPPSLLLELQQPASLAALTASLRRLKNELVGHDQRKELWIEWGILSILSRLLASKNSSGKNAAGQETNGANTAKRKGLLEMRTEEDEACVQAVIVLGSLAQGGPAFLAPIFASEILHTLLLILFSIDCPQTLSIQILRTLNAIADRLPLQSPEPGPYDTRLADLLFSKEHVQGFTRLIEQDLTSQPAQTSVTLAVGLIGKLYLNEMHKAILAESGVLDALSVKLASFVVTQGFVLPGAESYVNAPRALGALPAAAPRNAQLAPILRAVAVIVERSKYRAEHFLSSPGIVTVFPKQALEFAANDMKKAPWGSVYLSGSAVPRHFGASPIDSLLPSVPSLSHAKASASAANFPPLGPGGLQHRRHSQSFSTTFSLLDSSSSEEDESAVIAWLLYLTRDADGMTQLMAARLVTALFSLGFTKKQRLPMFSNLLIPILIRMLDKDYQVLEEHDMVYGGLISVAQQLREEAPAVLATLVIDDQDLQKHAIDGFAIKRLSALLKDSYRPIQKNNKSVWHAYVGDSSVRSAEAGPDCRLGPPGYSPVVCHIMRYRENVLKALAALIPFKDEYRKAVCDNGVVPYIIDSLKPRPSDPPTDTVNAKNLAADGNPIPTLLAACGAVRMLTRSVSVLRTNLIDAGVAQPLFSLIRHPDIEVRIAATSVISNLVLDFSPMKEMIISADVLPILCEHARSSNTKLRIESLWALKHVAYKTSTDVKIAIMKGLSARWVLHIIKQDPIAALTRRGLAQDLENGSPLRMGSANSVGEQVDLLNPMDDSEDQDGRHRVTDKLPSSQLSLDLFLPDAARRRKLALNGDLDQTTQARQDDIAVQEQTFDLLRNLICGPGVSEMIEYLFREMGQNEILDALADKLRQRTIHLPHRRDSSLANRSVQVPTEILVSVTFLIIHLAAAPPFYREMLVMHPDLLRFLMPYFNHPSREVRVNCVWIVLNLTYEDDPSDHEGCRGRAFTLRSLGVTEKLASLADDADLDVRERTKTAVHQLNSLSPV